MGRHRARNDHVSLIIASSNVSGAITDIRTQCSQHRLFHSSKLHFLPIATEDPTTGHIWSTILLPAEGHEKLEIRSPSPTDLVITALHVEGDPAVESLKNGGELIAGVGIEMSTRSVQSSLAVPWTCELR